MNCSSFNRRQWLGVNITYGLPLALCGLKPLAARANQSPSESIRIAAIGTGGQGTSNMGHQLKNIIAVCDVDRKRLGTAADRVQKANGRAPITVGDYRRILDNKEIDAVMISTPDHWHARIAVDACEAGKHVYCEKPLTLTVKEGRAIVNAARKHKRIVQTGSQQRSGKNFEIACQLTRKGVLGKLSRVEVGIPNVNFAGPPVADSLAPAELDYDLWLGPAPKRPFNTKRVHYNFRFFWDYSGGQMTNFGAHHLDIAQWGLGMDNSGPESISGTVTYHPDNWFEVPMSSKIEYIYPGGIQLVLGQGDKNIKGGTKFIGEKGWIFVSRGVLTASDKTLLGEVPKEALKADASLDHHKNWQDCIKSGKLPAADAEIGHRSATICHLGNIASRLKRPIKWDAVKETIPDDKEAAAMLSRPYRGPWKNPV